MRAAGDAVRGVGARMGGSPAAEGPDVGERRGASHKGEGYKMLPGERVC